VRSSQYKEKRAVSEPLLHLGSLGVAALEVIDVYKSRAPSAGWLNACCFLMQLIHCNRNLVAPLLFYKRWEFLNALAVLPNTSPLSTDPALFLRRSERDFSLFNLQEIQIHRLSEIKKFGG
jgi:hypothetical protein